MKKLKSQSSFEFMLIFAIGFTLVIIVSVLFISYSNGLKKNLDSKQIESIGEELISNINKVYFLGDGNMVTMDYKFPDGIDNLTIVHRNVSGSLYDYLNVSYIEDGGTLNSLILTANQNYIRFNCTLCSHSVNLNGNYTSSFYRNDFEGGAKKIKIKSEGSWVSVDIG